MPSLAPLGLMQMVRGSPWGSVMSTPVPLSLLLVA